MDPQNTTPMLRQYLEIKRQYPGTILFFRLGDFYELFNEDALTGSRELQITLTARHKDSARPVPMCGVPHHAAAGYIAKLVRKGYRVAICEQTENADPGKKLVRRDVVRIITPGTAIDPQLIDDQESLYLAAVCGGGGVLGAAFLDLSTGEFFATQHEGIGAKDKVLADLDSFAPREILADQDLESSLNLTGHNSKPPNLESLSDAESNSPSFTGTRPAFLLTPIPDSGQSIEDCTRLLCRQFGVFDLTAYGLKDKHQAVRAAGACVAYAVETQRAAASHITDITYFENSSYMVLDSITLRNLEIIESRGESSKRTLFNVINATVSGMGARLLRNWLVRPSLRRSEIQTRLSAVTELLDSVLRGTLRSSLRDISDLERLVGRINLGTASPRDLAALSSSLGHLPALNLALAGADSLLLQVLSENIFELPELRDLLNRALTDEPPINISDGGVIRHGFDPELDELRGLNTSAKQIIATIEQRERERTGVGSLKVKYNNVFGYFIEISNANLGRVPGDYIRRQTLANAERFITPELKELEDRILGAEARIREIETAVFQDLRRHAVEQTRSLQATARALATLDAVQSLAETAARRNYIAPSLHDGDELEIRSGRHPIVESFIPNEFVPNDIYLNNSTDRLLVITGPNMGGKSTALRQVAIIQILAQIGSFVPARMARLPIVDRVWTRVGANDDLASGRSTFMVEMTETAAILNNATPRSLVILDEIGRGTSTFDGLSIAWSVAEYLHDSPRHSAKTLFATHYHELTELADKLAGATNYHITAGEHDGEIIFFHRLEKGKASKSYGIAVAALAGLPAKAIARAREVLEKLEKYELAILSDDRKSHSANALEAAVERAGTSKASAQNSLFAVANENIIDELRELNFDQLTDVDARKILSDIQKRII
jgi:DNA mismatch repair protein MutS